MEKYKIELKNSQVISIGEKNKIKDIYINTSTHNDNMNLKELKNELAMLEELLRGKEEKNTDEKVLLADIIDIKQVAEKGAVDKVIKELEGKATSLFLNIATGVGSGIIANVLSKALGI